MVGSDSSMSFFLRTIVLLFSTSIFCNTFASLAQYSCHPDQRDALMEFKNEFKIRSPHGFLDFGGFPMDVTSYPKTNSWAASSDCCYWDGITCDVKSGKVIGLDLSCSCLHGRLEPNSSLFRLQHLQSLNLAYNNFTFSPIPAEFSTFMGLERLNLSQTSFSGQIPLELLQLTNLVSLDLSFSSFPYSPSSLSIEQPLFLHLLARNLRNLRELDMSSVEISSEFPHEFSHMWTLRSLSLRGCNLFGRFPSSVLLIPNLQFINLNDNQNLRGSLPNFRGNNSLLELHISRTSFSGTIPDSISSLKNLISLELWRSNFSGRIPSSLGNLSHLSSLILYDNNFIGEIPSSIGNLKQLIDFDVGNNKLSGNFPPALLNLTQLWFIGLDSNQFTGFLPPALLNLTQLCFIFLSSNQFTGFLPPNISQLSKLEYFEASHNYFTGAIPSSLFKISSLIAILLHNNNLNDLVGIENISLLHNLENFYIGNNNYKVNPVDLNLLSPLKQLVGLLLSGIPLSIANINSESDFPTHLFFLHLSDCNITKFPEFIRGQRDLADLNLSNNKIKGEVPDWLWKLPEMDRVNLSRNSLSGFKGFLKASPGSKISIVDLSSNAFQGPIFIPSISIGYYFASKNNFTGEIPQSLCGLRSLIALDLSNNNLHGSIPWCLGTHISSLSVLKLHSNRLEGIFPDIFIKAEKLRSLDVSHNRLEGKLPTSLKSCSSLEILNVGSNRISDTFPFWLIALQNLKVLVISSNDFHGTLHHPQVSFGFPQLRIIDASHNYFTGTLRSDYFTNWRAMYTSGDDTQLKYLGDDGYYYDSIVLMSKGVSMEMERILTIYTAIDFSGNQLHGRIPDSIGLLKGLRMLNLSSNAFTGHIPSSLANLASLESLDLSQNKISGEIPPALGTLSSLAWINISHNKLVGPIPQGTQLKTQKCSCYEGNIGLYGPVLNDVCGDIHAPTPPQPEPLETKEGKEEKDGEWFSWSAAGLGLVPGIVFGLTMGYIVASYKHEWFMNTFGRNKQRSTQ